MVRIAKLLLFIFVSIQAWALPALVQCASKTAPTNNVTSLTATFGTPTTAGHYIGVAVQESLNATDNFTVTDGTNLYTNLGYQNSNASYRAAAFNSFNVTPVSNVTVNFTTAGGVNFHSGIVACEFSGIQTSTATDGLAISKSNSNITSITSGPLTTSNSSDLLIFFVMEEGEGGNINPGSGFILADTLTRVGITYKNVSIMQTNVTTSASWPTSEVGASTFFQGLKSATTTPVPLHKSTVVF